MYSVASLIAPYLYFAAILCRLFGYAHATKFSVEWVPLIDDASNYIVMDWENFLSNNLACHIIEYRRNHYASTRTIHPFYMYAYVMDVVCFIFHFPIMGWKWTHHDPMKIHVYHKVLQKSCFSENFYQVCQGLCSLFIRLSLTRNPQGYQNNPRLIFNLWRDGLEKN